MIKVIGCDLDGTLLNDEQTISAHTIQVIKEACAKGIRFIIVTGRDYANTIKVLKGINLTCDLILNSGGEVRNQKSEIVKSDYMKTEDCIKVYHRIHDYPIAILYNATDCDYFVGTREELEDTLAGMLKLFGHQNSIDEIRESKWFCESLNRARLLNTIEEIDSEDIRITKILIRSDSIEVLKTIKALLMDDKNIAVASFFDSNLEITDATAQKGPILKEYIESLGYTMDEVIVFGDSLNDYSMLSMDFGVTVAMENAHPDLKKVAKYITKSNVEDGVAYVIEKLMSEDVIKRYKITFSGIVQNVGFRQEMCKNAQKFQLNGFCRNSYDGNVIAEIQGPRGRIEALLCDLKAIERFQIDEIKIDEIPLKESKGFKKIY